VLAGWRRWLEPRWAAVPLGLLLSLVAPDYALSEHGWVYAIAVPTAVAVMAASVALRNTPMLAMGTIGLFGYVTDMVVHYFADSLGVPTALALTGALILVLAAVSARLLRVMKKPEPDKREPGKPTDATPPAGTSLTPRSASCGPSLAGTPSDRPCEARGSAQVATVASGGHRLGNTGRVNRVNPR